MRARAHVFLPFTQPEATKNALKTIILNMDKIGDIVFPGEVLDDLKQSEKSGKSIIGPGLIYHSSIITVSKPGILKFKEPNVYWVDSVEKRVSYQNIARFFTMS